MSTTTPTPISTYTINIIRDNVGTPAALDITVGGVVSQFTYRLNLEAGEPEIIASYADGSGEMAPVVVEEDTGLAIATGLALTIAAWYRGAVDASITGSIVTLTGQITAVESASPDFLILARFRPEMPDGSFDPALLTPRDHVRLLLGDTDTTNILLADSTIDAMLAAMPYRYAVAQLAEALITQFGQMPDSYSEASGTTLRWSERIAAWKLLSANARLGKLEEPGATAVPRGCAALRVLRVQRAELDSKTGFRSD